MRACLGQSTTVPGAEHLDQGCRLVQGDADLTVMGDAGIFDDRCAHGSSGCKAHSA